MTYTPTIGLEIHAELSTKTKMFCGSKNSPHEAKPNTHVCPICMGHPGVLPNINKEAVRHVLTVGVALNGKLADYTEFDRKNYFYPDIPKGYQISQYKYPLVEGGSLNTVAITRVHLEEDTARSSHEKKNVSLVDYNRAGVPLMELVTEPVIHSAEDAVSFGRELRAMLRFLGVSEANMEMGQMRVEANVSISDDPSKLGTKVEIKNLNSFKAVEGGIKYEIKRQTELLKQGKEVMQETRGWDENKQVTFAQRKKEVAHDYRYFPDPDLPKLRLNLLESFSEQEIRNNLPELPEAYKSRLAEIGIHSEKIATLVTSDALRSFFAKVESALEADKKIINLAANYITSDIAGLINGGEVNEKMLSKRSEAEFIELLTMIQENLVSSRGAKEVLKVWLFEGGSTKAIAVKLSVLQQSNEGELEKLVADVISEHQSVFDEYKSGKAASLQFLIGQAMKKSKGAANPKMLAEVFEKSSKI